MGRDQDDNGGSEAMYWDFENLHAGLVDAKYGDGTYAKQDIRFKPQEPLVDVQALVELSASFGPVAINRAYGNWQLHIPTRSEHSVQRLLSTRSGAF